MKNFFDFFFFFCCLVYRAHGGFLCHNNRVMGFANEPRHLTHRASGRQRVETSTREMPWGLALHNSKAPAVPVVLYGCGVAHKNPHALLLEVKNQR